MPAFTTIETLPPVELRLYTCELPCTEPRMGYEVLSAARLESTPAEIAKGWPAEFYGARFGLQPNTYHVGRVVAPGAASTWSNAIPVPEPSQELLLFAGFVCLALAWVIRRIGN